MLTVHQLAKSFALKTLFENVTFSLNSGDRMALVGPNGCGKTTLLRIIAGEETADSGVISREPGLRAGYLAQGFTDYPGYAGVSGIMNDTLSTIVGRAAGDADILEPELAAVSMQLAGQPDDADLQLRYDDLLRRMSTADPGRAAAILAGLELDQLPGDLPAGLLSGGQKTRLGLALVLLDDPRLLLLDEPTNHLDIAMLEWLEEWLGAFPGAALIVSHDRVFLDRTVDRVLAMDPLSKTTAEFAGGYSDYEAQKAKALQKQWSAYYDQQQEIRRVKQDIQRTRDQAAGSEFRASSVRRGGAIMAMKGYKDYKRSMAKGVAQKAKARARKLERYLDDEERVEKPKRLRSMKLDFADTAHLGRFVIALEDLTIGYDKDAPLLSGLWRSVPPDARIVVSGPNGSGKSTLLRTIAGDLPPLAGAVKIGPSVKMGIMTQEQTNLDPKLTPLSTVRHAFDNETAARTFLAYFLFTGDEPLLRNEALSYGQRARLELARLVVEGCNVLLLDEPINHLDIASRDQFEQALSQFDGAVLAVVHDRAFIGRFAEQIWWLEDGRLVYEN
ncbi:MAG: ribosomal protection-like ABC-F family protein [Candidatus Promineifilaceae bacterium]